MRPSSGVPEQAGTASRASVSTETSPRRTEAPAETVRLATSSAAGRHANVTEREPAATGATRSTLALPG